MTGPPASRALRKIMTFARIDVFIKGDTVFGTVMRKNSCIGGWHDRVRRTMRNQDSWFANAFKAVSLGQTAGDFANGRNLIAPETKCNAQVAAKRLAEDIHRLVLNPRQSFRTVKQHTSDGNEYGKAGSDFVLGNQTLASNRLKIVRQHHYEAVSSKHFLAQIIPGGFLGRFQREGASRTMKHKYEREGSNCVGMVYLEGRIVPLDPEAALAIYVATGRRPLTCCRRRRSVQPGHQKRDNNQPPDPHEITLRGQSYHFRQFGSRALQIAALGLIPFHPTSPLQAQSFSDNEFSLGIATQTWAYRYRQSSLSPSYTHVAVPVLSLGYTRNIARSLAVEGVFQPTSQFFRTNFLESGRQTLALGGVKAGWRGSQWGFYGKTQGGVQSWSCGAFDYAPNPYLACSRLTNFALEYGAVAERQLVGPYSLRFDAGHLLGLEFPKVLASGPNYVVFREGGALQHLDLRLAITRNFGTVHNGFSEHDPGVAKWDAGTAFVIQPRVSISSPDDLQIFPSPSLWASWNFSRHISWDSALIYSGPMRDRGHVYSDIQAGGRSLEALTGSKMGLRRDHMGYFAKLRGGTITFGETERVLGILPNGHFFLDRGMFTDFVLDVGGVYEVYPSRHTILRFDAGSTTIFYQPKTSLSLGQSVYTPSRAQTGMLLGFGGGFRF